MNVAEAADASELVAALPDATNATTLVRQSSRLVLGKSAAEHPPMKCHIHPFLILNNLLFVRSSFVLCG